MDMPRDVNGAKKTSFATPIREPLKKDIFGKSGAAVTITVPGKHMGNREVYLHILKQENLPVFIYISFNILFISSGKSISIIISFFEIG